ncbi:AEC family transporter [Phragmitibacter flavus]|uniref:AEC family transporter n=1 Tax=Phragmitibacter flavus TaxID=2576071 RepID=A0A5R8KEU1_9BACT|nr:AEC family transporter [Phragmitibacter flavus]TLD70823.1 AEC family transporter [Phragmitibacter flavus]
MFLFELFLNVCAPIFVVVGLGWVLDRKFRLHLETLVKLNIYLLVPAFIFCRVLDTELGEGEALKIVGFTMATIFAMFVASAVLGRLLGLNEQRKRALGLATMFYNCGNYGLPLVTLAFGHEGAAVQVYVLATMNVATFTIGLFLAQKKGEVGDVGQHWRTLMKVLRQPTLYALMAGMLCRWMGWRVQEVNWLWQPLDLLQSGLIGFALVTLGVQMSQTRPEPFRAPLWAALGTRLVMGPLVAVGLVNVLGFSPLVAGSLILAAGAPTAVNTALLAHEFEGDVSFATSAVYYSTIFSMVTTTVTLALLKG